MNTALAAFTSGGATVVDLGQPLSAATPHSPNAPPFLLSPRHRHGDVVLRDGVSFANELLVTGGHTGTHVDALGHVSHDGRAHGSRPVAAIQGAEGLSALGIDELEPIVARGILLDVAAVHGCDVLPAGYGITADDLAEAERRAGDEVRAGDVVLVRSGWGRHYGDPEAFVGHASGVPGPTEAAARWLAQRRIRATGAETIAYEQIHPGAGHAALPVHRLLLVEHGIHIVEVMRLDGLAPVTEPFLFVLAPLKLLGATASPARPIAVVPGERRTP